MQQLGRHQVGGRLCAERVDVRVLQVIYQLPETNGLFRVGQQVDAYIAAEGAGQ